MQAGGDDQLFKENNKTFDVTDGIWNEERALDRYELLYEAGLVEEARRDGRPAALERDTLPSLGRPMLYDHRRILATAISRLRTKLKYRPVVFELMPHAFTLTDLQRCVEAISANTSTDESRDRAKVGVKAKLDSETTSSVAIASAAHSRSWRGPASFEIYSPDPCAAAGCAHVL